MKVGSNLKKERNRKRDKVKNNSILIEKETERDNKEGVGKNRKSRDKNENKRIE
jgi:hypothetical protein